MISTSVFAVGDYTFRSGEVKNGFSYTASGFAFPCEESYYPGFWQIREWQFGIKERLEIYSSPWQMITIGLKVNILRKGQYKLFQNIALASFAGFEGYDVWEIQGSYSDARAYGGFAPSTKQNYPNAKTLELAFSPNIAFAQYDYIFDDETNDPAVSSNFIDLNLPVWGKFYIGRSVRFNFGVGLVGILPIAETNILHSKRDWFSIGINLGVDFGTKQTRKSMEEMWSSGDIY
jgi:hypothetical protein